MESKVSITIGEMHYSFYIKEIQTFVDVSILHCAIGWWGQGQHNKLCLVLTLPHQSAHAFL